MKRPLLDSARRQAYISSRFQGSSNVIENAYALAVKHEGYGFLPGQHVCSTFNATAYNNAGNKGWYGVGPNSQSDAEQFRATKVYGK